MVHDVRVSTITPEQLPSNMSLQDALFARTIKVNPQVLACRFGKLSYRRKTSFLHASARHQSHTMRCEYDTQDVNRVLVVLDHMSDYAWYVRDSDGRSSSRRVCTVRDKQVELSHD